MNITARPSCRCAPRSGSYPPLTTLKINLRAQEVPTLQQRICRGQGVTRPLFGIQIAQLRVMAWAILLMISVALLVMIFIAAAMNGAESNSQRGF